jgi:hypothetical protein
MDRDFSEEARGGAAQACQPAAERPSRYDFEVPEGIPVSDLLAIQLAECARLVRNLTDSASNPHLMDIERLRMVDQLKDIVGASTQLSREIDHLQNGAPRAEDESAHGKKRKT